MTKTEILVPWVYRIEIDLAIAAMCEIGWHVNFYLNDKNDQPKPAAYGRIILKE